MGKDLTEWDLCLHYIMKTRPPPHASLFFPQCVSPFISPLPTTAPNRSPDFLSSCFLPRVYYTLHHPRLNTIVPTPTSPTSSFSPPHRYKPFTFSMQFWSWATPPPLLSHCTTQCPRPPPLPLIIHPRATGRRVGGRALGGQLGREGGREEEGISKKRQWT